MVGSLRVSHLVGAVRRGKGHLVERGLPIFSRPHLLGCKKHNQAVTPAKAGVQKPFRMLDSRLRGNDRKDDRNTFCSNLSDVLAVAWSRRDFGLWKDEGEGASLTEAAGHRDVSLVGAGKGLGQTQAKTCSWLRPAVVAAVESLEDMGEIARRNAWPGVPDGDDRFSSVFFRKGDPHSPSGRGVFESVIQKVCEDSLDHSLVYDKREALGCFARQAQASVLSHSLEQFTGIADQAGHVDLPVFELVHSGLGFCDHEHGIDHVEQAVALFHGARCHILIFPDRFCSTQGHLGHASNPRDGALQVMGDVVRHLLDLGDEGLNATKHLIERRSELIDLIAPASYRNAFVQSAS
jgi:hypothetical protein